MEITAATTTATMPQLAAAAGTLEYLLENHS